MIAWARLIVILPAIAVLTLALAPLQLWGMRYDRRLARRIPVLWHRMALRLVGVRVHVRGPVPARRPLLIVANHLSWSDILVLGSVTELCFIAKSEVRSWPVFNLLAILQRTVFIDREQRRRSQVQAGTIAARLLEGDAMVLFAEGTTGDGVRLAPFKSALFGSVHEALKAALHSHVTVQPVAIAYTRLHGLPLGRLHQARAAWPGDVALLPHFLSFLRAGAWDVDVVFCEPGDFSAQVSRKEIARLSHERVRAAFADAMRMRGRAAPPPALDRDRQPA